MNESQTSAELRGVFGGLLHDYQLECVAALSDFANAEAREGAHKAFAEISGKEWRRTYKPAPGMDDAPYLCIKVPTGGGKTLIAAASVGALAERIKTRFGPCGTDSPTVLWLAPTGAIVEQTLRALQDSENRCRRALDAWFPGVCINPIALKDAYNLSPADLRAGPNIIVATYQSLRVENPEGRKIYESAGLIAHFRDLPERIAAELRENGGIVSSLANVFKIHRPIIVVDEAHNACTEKSFQSFARFSPSWILEMTATPRAAEAKKGGETVFASNVLHQVSAFDLKRRDMIKAPIYVWASNNWRASARDALGKRGELEKAAEDAGAAFVPVALFQAEPESKDRETVTAEVLRKALMEDFNAPENEIAVAIGGRDELTPDVGTRGSPVRYVITVRKLAEGWDCPAAYVLCSVANIGAGAAVEQLLGRVLRLPGARKQGEALSAAHVFAAKTTFAEAAKSIVSVLEKAHGFKRDEAERTVAGETGGLFSDGGKDPNAALPGKLLRIPRLAIRIGDQLELLDESCFFLGEPWKAADLPADLPDFEPEISVSRGKVDVKESGMTLSPDQSGGAASLILPSDMQLTMADVTAQIAKWLKPPDIPPAQVVAFVRAALQGIKEKHKLHDAELAANRFRLRSDIMRRLNGHRRARRRAKIQQTLTGALNGRKLETTPECALEFSAGKYFPSELCGDAEFKKHIFPNKVGKMDSGEELECAVYIDALPEVECWLRNLSKDEAGAFWLPTSSDLFYPDFVARLKDGRHLVVEYKNERDWSNDDSKEKRDIGEAWEKMSAAPGGKPHCLFVMPKGKTDLAAIERKIRGG